MRTSLCLLLVFVATLLFAREVRAQGAPCNPPWCVRVEPPPVVIRPPPVVVQPPPVVVTPPQAPFDPELAARARADAAWSEYFQWEISLRAKVRAELQAKFEAEILERARAEASLTPDRFAGVRSPVTPAPYEPPATFWRAEVGMLVPPCAAVWTGPGAPVHAGYCPNLRVRFDPTWGLAFDPSVVAMFHGTDAFTAIGFHPGVTYSFAGGSGRLAASHAYAIAGVDGWFPVTQLAVTPTAFVGGHVGLGVAHFSGALGMTAEVRALSRWGLGHGSDDPSSSATASAMSKFQVGFEARVSVLAVSF